MNQVADYKSRWLPVQAKLAEQVSRAGAEGSAERRQAGAMSGMETGVRFGQARGRLESGLGQVGALGAPKGKLALAGLAEDQATSQGLGRTQAEQDIDNAYTAGLATLMGIGRGEKAGAIQGMTRTAALSGQRAAADADAALTNRMGNAQLAGQVAGIGLSYAAQPGAADAVRAKFSQTGLGASGFGTGLAYGNQDLGRSL